MVDMCENLWGMIMVEFKWDCLMLWGFGKFLFIEVFVDKGVYIDDFKNW